MRKKKFIQCKYLVSTVFRNINCAFLKYIHACTLLQFCGLTVHEVTPQIDIFLLSSYYSFFVCFKRLISPLKLRLPSLSVNNFEYFWVVDYVICADLNLFKSTNFNAHDLYEKWLCVFFVSYFNYSFFWGVIIGLSTFVSPDREKNRRKDAAILDATCCLFFWELQPLPADSLFRNLWNNVRVWMELLSY